MATFFNVETLKEPVQTIAEKYPRWLQANQDKLEPKELENHRQQCELYLQVWQKLENKNKDQKVSSADMEEIMELLTKTFSYGSLPTEVMDGMMPDELKQFANQMLQLEQELEKEEKQKADSTTMNSANSNSNANANANADNSKNSSSSSSDGKGPPENMDPAASLKFLEQLMNEPGQSSQDAPKLSPDDVKQMQQLMNSDCLLM